MGEDAGARYWRSVLPLVAVVLLLPLLPAASSVSPLSAALQPAAKRHVVAMRAFAFAPADLRVAVGDTVVWVNHDPVPHNATSRTVSSGEITPGASVRVVMKRRGSIEYVCTYHPGMKGRLDVR